MKVMESKYYLPFSVSTTIQYLYDAALCFQNQWNFAWSDKSQLTIYMVNRVLGSSTCSHMVQTNPRRLFHD